jgi:hypothetical protein
MCQLVLDRARSRCHCPPTRNPRAIWGTGHVAVSIPQAVPRSGRRAPWPTAAPVACRPGRSGTTRGRRELPRRCLPRRASGARRPSLTRSARLVAGSAAPARPSASDPPSAAQGRPVGYPQGYVTADPTPRCACPRHLTPSSCPSGDQVATPWTGSPLLRCRGGHRRQSVSTLQEPFELAWPRAISSRRPRAAAEDETGPGGWRPEAQCSLCHDRQGSAARWRAAVRRKAGPDASQNNIPIACRPGALESTPAGRRRVSIHTRRFAG